MKETRSLRFKRLAEARVNKIIKMVRLLGNLSITTIYAYEPDQIVQIFTAIQDELNKARSRFYNFVSTSAVGGRKRAYARTWHSKSVKWRRRYNGISEKHICYVFFLQNLVLQTRISCVWRFSYEAGKQNRKRFTLSDPPVSDLPEEREPNFEVMLPDGTKLRAVGFEEDEYPGICIYARSPGKPPAIICLTEYNPEKNEGHQLYIGAYQSHLDDPKYYEPYVAERN